MILMTFRPSKDRVRIYIRRAVTRTASRVLVSMLSEQELLLNDRAHGSRPDGVKVSPLGSGDMGKRTFFRSVFQSMTSVIVRH
jgi:hypothetical protein